MDARFMCLVLRALKILVAANENEDDPHWQAQADRFINDYDPFNQPS